MRASVYLLRSQFHNAVVQHAADIHSIDRDVDVKMAATGSRIHGDSIHILPSGLIIYLS